MHSSIWSTEKGMPSLWCHSYNLIMRQHLINPSGEMHYRKTQSDHISRSVVSNSLRLVEVIEFQLSYSKSWKMILWKCCTQYASKFGKLSSGHRTGKGQFSFQSQRKTMPTTAQLHSSHMLVKECSKFSKPGFNSTWTMNFQMFKLDLEKAEESEIKFPTSVGASKKQENSRKTSTPFYWLCQNRWLCRSH